MGQKGDAVDGVLLLDKPEAMSSNWALQLTRRLINARKAGHTGTLDPMATGLLPLAFGNATKYSADLLKADKRYVAEIKFGVATDTMDKSGTAVRSSAVRPSCEDLCMALAHFTGEIEQLPPMYSAIKHEGRNLYDLARKGIEIERTPRKVTVKELKLLSWDGETARVEALVSKGTYIRVLADDLGSYLKSAAHLTALRRIAVGALKIEDAVSFDVIDDKTKTVEERRGYLKGADFLLSTLPEITLDEENARRLENGQRLALKESVRGEARAYGPNRKLLGVVSVDQRGTVHPLRLITFLGNPDCSGKEN